MRKVVVTGIGMINGLGHDYKTCFEAITNGDGAIKQLSPELTEATGVKFGAPVCDYVPSDYFNKRALRSYDLVNQYAILAAREAAANAGLDIIENRDSIGVNVTSGIGGIETIANEVETAVTRGYKRVSPSFIPKAIINLVAGNVAIDLKCHGICNSLVTACASSTDAVGHAKMYIENGLVDVMVTGGAEACVNEISLAGFQNLGALSRGETADRASIPFDEQRSGFVMGEGACVLILEAEEHAKQRGAKILGYIEGYGATCDANHITAPDPEATYGVKAVETALKQANLTAKEVGLINCHGTSTPLNDAGEIKLLTKVYKDNILKPYVTSTKSNTGHMLGAAGATEIAFSILSLNNKIVTPTIGTKVVAEECNANICLEETKSIDTDYAMSLSLGFGGHNSCIIMKRGDQC